jgi:hypothetical protein
MSNMARQDYGGPSQTLPDVERAPHPGITAGGACGTVYRATDHRESLSGRVVRCNVLSAICYAAVGDYHRAIYWAASAACIGAITF